MSLQLVPSLRKNAQSIFSRAISLDSTKYCKRDVIAVDVTKDIEDVTTHTGQKFALDDSRRVRFYNAKKYVNPNIAIELIAKVPPIPSKERIVWCDGGDEHLGHPKVYINLDKPGDHTCGYCGLRFFKEDSHH
ncbi:hypothetical protein V9T40_012329 [Parthenolecanium corni]|uniref:Zinc finger CHCC-type domain-containing protein n=1 Tax=Parthenolecanium corni TaxID=536013 RepID=A0AAN9T744_9HEMI